MKFVATEMGTTIVDAAKVPRPSAPSSMRLLFSLLVYALSALGFASADANSRAADSVRLPGASIAMSVRKTKIPVDAFRWRDMSGAPFGARGNRRFLLINAWATWCAPCVKELPLLDALATSRSRKFDVIAVSQDTGGSLDVRPFLERVALRTLPIALDPSNSTMRVLRGSGLPITILVSPDGFEVARLIGTADWADPRTEEILNSIVAASSRVQ